MVSPEGGRRNARKGTGRLRTARGTRYSRATARLPRRTHRTDGRGLQRRWSNRRPAAAVIPAPEAYIKVVAVKKLVVELQLDLIGPPHGVYCLNLAYLLVNPLPFIR